MTNGLPNVPKTNFPNYLRFRVSMCNPFVFIQKWTATAGVLLMQCEHHSTYLIGATNRPHVNRSILSGCIDLAEVMFLDEN